jgi:hypothetical protein
VESKQGSGMCLGNRREKVEENDDIWEHDRELLMYGAEIWG